MARCSCLIGRRCRHAVPAPPSTSLLVCNLVQPISLKLASPFATQGCDHGGHVWLPLRVSADPGGATIVGELIEQIEAIRAVAEGA